MAQPSLLSGSPLPPRVKQLAIKRLKQQEKGKRRSLT
jgi:hypothetical protein